MEENAVGQKSQNIMNEKLITGKRKEKKNEWGKITHKKKQIDEDLHN